MSMPKITSAFNGWQDRIVLLRHSETVDANGFVDDTAQPLSFYGTIQPLKPREIELKPEGQRSFTWLQIHCQTNATTLIPGDSIKWKGQLYKVMARIDYSLNGYVEYHIIKNYQGISCSPLP